jgi:hypothetical protein
VRGLRRWRHSHSRRAEGARGEVSTAQIGMGKHLSLLRAQERHPHRRGSNLANWRGEHDELMALEQKARTPTLRQRQRR